ncbi:MULTISPECIES: neutral zinc metallopeptidase [Prauserella]|uniref:neutral zinc metallopeptidase n=1 Tax=Prauserella TaxID=142577 RepID=UPI0013054702|nr:MULTISPECIES: neutral zinc metallopeptidase [Prauserella]
MDRIDDVRPARNNPFAVLGVLVAVLGVVGVIALAGRAAAPVKGVALPSPNAVPDLVSAPPVESPPRTPAAEPAADPGANPLLGEGVALAGVTCDLPVLGGSAERLRAFYSAALSCLDAAWRPVLTETGARFTEAGLEIRSDASSRCGAMPGEDEATAFYCGAEGIIYMPRERLVEYLGLYRPAHLAVLAHEYGHHVQKLSGTLDATAERMAGLDPGSPGELELTRRAELQANCFAGLFLAAVAGRGEISWEEARSGVDDFANSIDSDTHGTLENQVRWAETGFLADGPAACNTWTAPAADVA